MRNPTDGLVLVWTDLSLQPVMNVLCHKPTPRSAIRCPCDNIRCSPTVPPAASGVYAPPYFCRTGCPRICATHPPPPPGVHPASSNQHPASIPQPLVPPEPPRINYTNLGLYYAGPGR